jgi:hypothetical protein
MKALEHEAMITRHIGHGTFLADAVTRKVDGAPADTSPAENMQVRRCSNPRSRPQPPALLGRMIGHTPGELVRGGMSLDL